MNQIIALLQRLVAVYTNVVVNSGNIPVTDSPTSTHNAINEVLADMRYTRSYGVAANYSITGLTTLDISLIANYANCNEVTLTSTNPTETINNITNLPAGIPWIVHVNTGLTVTFTNAANANPGSLKTGGGANFVSVGTNQDFAVFRTGTGTTVLRIGGLNF